MKLPRKFLYSQDRVLQAALLQDFHLLAAGGHENSQPPAALSSSSWRDSFPHCSSHLFSWIMATFGQTPPKFHHGTASEKQAPVHVCSHLNFKCSIYLQSWSDPQALFFKNGNFWLRTATFSDSVLWPGWTILRKIWRSICEKNDVSERP